MRQRYTVSNRNAQNFGSQPKIIQLLGCLVIGVPLIALGLFSGFSNQKAYGYDCGSAFGGLSAQAADHDAQPTYSLVAVCNHQLDGSRGSALLFGIPGIIALAVALVVAMTWARAARARRRRPAGDVLAK